MTRKSRRFILAALILATGNCAGRGANVLDIWESSNHGLHVRVRKFDESSPMGIAMHTYFTFEAVEPASGRWREILEWRIGGPADIRRDRVRLVSDQVNQAR